ncbi:MAG: hypothetical protein LBQ91_04780 [Oscillospiraceae bacterium]|nr:hypothetical protein [Oscillospiraceae bacterium]
MKKDDIYKPNISGLYSGAEDVYGKKGGSVPELYHAPETAKKDVYNSDLDMYGLAPADIYGISVAGLYDTEEEQSADAQKTEFDPAP